jgi:hypothetical protein
MTEPENCLDRLVDLSSPLTTNRHLHPAYYDRAGNQISMRRQCELGRDIEYRILKKTPVPGGQVISAWLGDDRRVIDNGEPPLIYGTIFYSDTDIFEYSTEEYADSPEKALASHEQLVELITALSDLSTLAASSVPKAPENNYSRMTVSPELPVTLST